MNFEYLFLSIIILSLLFYKNDNALNLFLFIFMLFLIVLVLNLIKNEASTTSDVHTDKAKSVNNKRKLEQVFDAILNKNTSSTD
ncbi:hypothetical protein [Urbanus proteus nucleopolyhedrovirus]|uniref:Uncharacterized protein n=1 Tax=Urbanus proteus nucleopolyhedrovirus TaxID=1675866 RepID=A0A161C6Y5_9ABAC|nr:hypothetical protein [Urbanus proteus nucleopolyhedrovirus]AKR17365.1 hypothetical protein [Urbanus proteus nucleopolyhedrovirus]